MEVHHLLLRGMLAGLLAGLLAFGFAKAFGERPVNQSIAFEAAEAVRQGAPAEEEIVSRAVQGSLGLLTGVVVFAVALGGLFGLGFAICHGRLGPSSPEQLAALMALIGFVVVTFVPGLKYPPNPPAVGVPATIGARTALFGAMICVSVLAAAASFSLRRLCLARLGTWSATLAGLFTFALLAAVACAILPSIDEVPSGFPAQTLWTFRLDSLAIQAILWAVLGIGFGFLTSRVAQAGRGTLGR